jgi:hypothetical protein
VGGKAVHVVRKMLGKKKPAAPAPEQQAQAAAPPPAIDAAATERGPSAPPSPD